MLRILLIVLVVYWLYKTVGKFFLRTLTSRQQRQNPYQGGDAYKEPRKPRDGNVNVDYVPKDNEHNSKDFKGGEYIDYEEVE